MCGIAGFVAARGREGPARERIDEAVQALEHRGPDGQGFHYTSAVALGQTRLSIIDIEGGNQPLANEDASVLTIYNGEIWNHQELRRELERAGHRFATRCDTEVLVHGYEEWGDELPSRLRGMFALAIWDERRERLLLARDRVGKKPLYVAETEAGLAFGSDARSVGRGMPRPLQSGATWSSPTERFGSSCPRDGSGSTRTTTTSYSRRASTSASTGSSASFATRATRTST